MGGIFRLVRALLRQRCMTMLQKSLGVTALMMGLVGSLAACAGAVDDHGCGFGGCGRSPDESMPTTPAPSPAPDPVQSPPSGGKKTSDVTAEDCPAPYHVATDDARCVWSCSIGTHPDPSGGIECVCQDGLAEVDSDNFGRRVCK